MNYYRDMKMSKKLISAFIVVSLICCSLLGAVSFISLNRINATGKAIYEENIVPLTPVHNAYADILNIRICLPKLALVSSNEDRSALKAQVEQYLSDMYADLDSYAAEISSDEEQNNYDTLVSDLVKWKSAVNAYMDYIFADNLQAAMKIPTSDDLIALEAEIDQCFDNAFSVNTDQASERSTENETAGRTTIFALCVVINLAIVVSVIYGSVVGKMITKPILRVVKAADSIATGSIDAELIDELSSIQRKDEIGDLANSMLKAVKAIEGVSVDAARIGAAVDDNDLSIDVNTSAHKGMYKNIFDTVAKLFGQMNHTISAIHVVSEQVSAGAVMVSTAAQNLAQGATMQASAVEELSVSTNGVADSAQSNVESLNVCANYIDRAGSGVRQSNEQMQQLLTAMDEINYASGQISGIIKIINDISFQTNILALNASVEAARAGNAGKGFAVVAGEVRNLAQKSAEAAQQTEQLIQNTIGSAERGKALAETTAKSLADVAVNAQSVEETNRDIMSSLTLQATAISEIKQGLNQISAVVQSNSATAEESAAASEELSAQANTLYQQVAAYKTKTED